MSTLEDLTEQEQRLIAADFAERVLPLFEAEYPDDDRPRKAIDAARAFARGEITKEQLSAAGDNALAAAGTAALAAAWSAALPAAWAAALPASRAAAWSAAASAARAAAVSAARAASASTAGASTAGASAAGAARDAAKYAERAWQQQHIDEVVAARAKR